MYMIHLFAAHISIYKEMKPGVCNNYKLLSQGYLYNFRLPGMDQGGSFDGFLNPRFCSGFPHGYPSIKQCNSIS